MSASFAAVSVRRAPELGELRQRLGQACLGVGQTRLRLGQMCPELGELRQRLGQACLGVGQARLRLGQMCPELGELRQRLGQACLRPMRTCLRLAAGRGIGVQVVAHDEKACDRGRQRRVGGEGDQVGGLRQVVGRGEAFTRQRIEDPRGEAALADDGRADHRALRRQRDVAEPRAQHGLEFRPVELAHMEGVGRRARPGIDVAVRRADDQQPARAQHPPALVEEAVLAVEMLQRLEGDDDVDGGVRQRDRPCIAEDVAEAGPWNSRSAAATTAGSISTPVAERATWERRAVP